MASRALGTSVVLALTMASSLVALPTAQATAPSGPAQATTALPGKKSDFNGDGYADLAFTAPGATVDGLAGAGYVGVVYGSATGLKTATKQVITQNSAGIPDAAEASDAFGTNIVSADLDQDGYADLVVGTWRESVGSVFGAGSLTVVWGGAGGLSGGATLLTGENNDYVGSQLVVGDFNGDGSQDIGTTRASAVQFLKGPFTRQGSSAGSTAVSTDYHHGWFDMAAGDLNGDGFDEIVGVSGGEDYRTASLSTGGPAGPGPFVDMRHSDVRRFEGGETVAIGNVNGDAYADIVVGRDDGLDGDEDFPFSFGGMITYVPGGATGPQVGKAKMMNQDSTGVPGAAEYLDGFGSSLSIADTNGDGFGEVAVGVPNEALETTKGAGGIVILPGTAAGPTGTGSTGFNQTTAGITGTAEAGDLFGGAAAFIDGNKDGRAELAVSAPGENAGEGSMWVIPSMKTGTGSFTFGHGTLGTVAVKAALGASINR